MSAEFFTSMGGRAIVMGETITWNFGLVRAPQITEAFIASLSAPNFAQAAPHLRGTGEGKNVFAWTLEEQILGKRLPAWNQSSIGSCVSHGWGRAVQDLMLVQIASGTDEWPSAEVCREAIYGGSRIEVGNGQLGGEDGSVGAWAAKWVSGWGILLYKKYGSVDLSGGYSVERCRSYGSRGVPSDLETEAKLHPVQDTALITSVEQARDAIANLKFVAICGSNGRTMQRMSGGWCPVEGNWGHCQELPGVCVAKGGRQSPWGGDGAAPYAGSRPAFVYRNSWGDYLGSANNRVMLDNGNEIELPDGCYLSTFEEVAPELEQRDTFCVDHATGWARATLPWIFS